MLKLTRLLTLPLALAAFVSTVSTLSAQHTLRIGYQKSGAFLLVRNEGTLEQKLKPLGYDIEWREFSSGPPVLEALNAGAIDIGHSGDAPLIFAQAKGVPFLYIGQSLASPDSTAILVPKDSPLKTIADLKGKKLAFAKGSSSHFVVAQALIKANLTFADITPVYLSPPDGRAAFQSGTIDAWAVWDPFFAAAEVDAQARVLSGSERLQSHREFYFARPDFAAKNAAIIDTVLAVLTESGEKAIANPKATAAFLAPKLGTKLEILERSEGRKQRYTAKPLDAQGIAEQQEVADTFLKLGLIPAALKVKDVVHQPAK